MWPTAQTIHLAGVVFALLHVVAGIAAGQPFVVTLGAVGVLMSYGLWRRSDSVRVGSIVLLTLYVVIRLVLGAFVWRGAGAAVQVPNIVAILGSLYLVLALGRLAGAFASKRDMWLGVFISKYLPLLPYLFFALFPLYFMLVTSLKTDNELYDLEAVPFWITGAGFTVGNYGYLFEETPYAVWMFNTLKVSICATAISVAIAILAAYALARLRFRGAETFGVAVFVTYLVPPSLLFLPLARVVDSLGLSDRTLALIVTYPTFLIPFCTWLLMGYFRTIPKEIEECAMIDGCNRIPGTAAYRPADGRSGHHMRGPLRLHPVVERVSLLPRVHIHHGCQDHIGGCHLRAHPGRHLLLGTTHGRRHGRVHSHRRRVRLLHGLLRLGPDGGGGQVAWGGLIQAVR